MASKVFSGHIISALAASADHNSAFLEGANASSASFQVVWTSLTGTLDGVFKVQTSNSNGAYWDDKSGATVTVSGNNGTNTININLYFSEDLIRIVWTHNNVTGGTIDVFAILKG